MQGHGQLWSMPVDDVLTVRTAASKRLGEAEPEYVRGMFSAIAPRYDLLNHLLSFSLDRYWRRRALDELQWQRAPHATYVDLCAGTLDVAARLDHSPGFSGRIVAADFVETMLRAGRAKVRQSVVAPVVADALDLPLADGSAAGAIVAFGIRNVVDLDAALRETYRVLSAGARFVILEFTKPRNWFVRSICRLYEGVFVPIIGGLISGHATAYRYLPASVARFPSEEELAAKMRAAGFADVQWQQLTLGVVAIHVGTKR
jgi:demethylmenaquinone methyltransferase / 2-methoxy-6-polyprenyl-1,4-benzoquinol methylase